MNWVKDHIVEVVLGVAGLVGAGSIIALANDVVSIITDKPYAVMAVAFCGVVIGVLVCYLSGLKEYRIEKLKIEHQDAVIEREKQEAEEKNKRTKAEKDKKRTEALVVYFKNLDFMEKVLIYAIYLKGSHDVPTGGYCDMKADDLIDFVCSEVIEDGIRLTLNEETKSIFNDYPEILEVVKDYYEREKLI